LKDRREVQRIVVLAFLFFRFHSLVETIKASQLGGRFSPLVSSFACMSLAPKIVTLAMHITRYFWSRWFLYLEILGGNDIFVERARVVLLVDIDIDDLKLARESPRIINIVTTITSVNCYNNVLGTERNRKIEKIYRIIRWFRVSINYSIISQFNGIEFWFLLFSGVTTKCVAIIQIRENKNAITRRSE